MTTPTGAIAFSQIEAEFGAPPLNNLGAYRVNQSIAGRTWPLDTGVPTIGPISFSQLKGRTANVVVDYNAGTEYNVNASSRYTANGVVVGGFKGVPGNTETKKVYNIIREIVSNFEGGTWDGNTVSLNYYLDGGQLYGAGGNGGNGSGAFGTAPGGSPGSSALTVRYPCNVVNNGYIQSGFGGGGGGGGAFDDPDKNPNDPVNPGGGGGGGAGLPAGSGGTGQSAGSAAGGGSPGNPGSPGTLTTGGGGGAGGNTRQAGSSYGGSGGNGGGPGASTNGQPGQNANLSHASGGPAGVDGYSIYSISNAVVTYSGVGTIVGSYNIPSTSFILFLDASNPSSYSGSGNTWYDLSGNGNHATLVNSPTFTTDNGGALVFNGTNYIDSLNISSYANLTIEMWVYDTRSNSGEQDILTYNGDSGSYTFNGSNFRTDGNYIAARSISGIGYPPKNQWYRFLYVKNGSLWINTTKYSSGSGSDSTYGSLSFANTRSGINSRLQGKIGAIYVYNRSLTDGEIIQTYNRNYARFSVSPSLPTVITQNLVLALDASNSSSYPGSGTTWYDLSSSANNGTLVNGVGYNSSNGGSLTFNGTNQYIGIGSTGFPFGSSPGTISAWAKTSQNNTYGWIISYGNPSNSQSRFIGIVGSTYYFGGYNDDITASGVQLNTWFNMVGVYDGTSAYMYINGSLVSGPTAKSWNTVANTAQLGRQTGGDGYWNGNIGQVLMYNRALTAGEVSQNYDATRTRFGL